MMLLRRLDDYQSWQISYAGTSILIDPWLTPEPIRGAFDRQHPAGFTSLRDLQLESGSIGAIVLCTSVNDHLRAETLKLMSDVPVHGNLKAAKAASAVGCTSTHAHQIGDTFTVACSEGGEIRITVTQTGLPLGLIAVGYLFEAIDAENNSAGRVWIEPHQPTKETAQLLGNVDVAVLPTQSVVAVVLPVTAGPKKSAQAAKVANARALVATATQPRRDMKLWQKALYYVNGSNAHAHNQLVGTNTQFIELRTGDWLDVKSGR
jgi:L-ascorbate metabolism protein UlaG (beta-lactamase superfamily)